MKSFYQNVISAPLYVLVGALLLCFGSCQSSDNVKAGEGASVASLPLTAQLGEASSRVGMSDTYGGAFSCYWNSDKFNVFHQYVLSGTVGSMTPLEFSTPATNGTSAKFSYTGANAYRYNPGSRLYAFSKGASGGYTASVAADGTSTLTAPTLASQKGTLPDCANYDALYGSADVDYSTGKPESLAMHHLFGMMNLHLTSSTFSTSYPVTVKLTSSAANILPDNSGNATLNADGSLNVLTGSWGTSWTATVTPTTNGVVDVYFMSWPFSAINGTLTVSCSDGTGYNYTPLTTTISSFSLAAAQIKSKQLAIVNAPAPPDATYSKLYAWDATDFQPITLNTVPTNTNSGPIVGNYSIGYASYACKNCPCYNEISWYLSVPCYWDNGSINGGNKTNYILADGTTTTAGMWFRKSSGIVGFSSTALCYYNGSPVGGRTPITLTSDLASQLNLSSNYFFLPAAGTTRNNTGTFSGAGTVGNYWTSTPRAIDCAISLNFNSSNVSGFNGWRASGACLFQRQ